jgi:lysophospholipase
LTKLAYLLGKPELSIKEVRDLMGAPLRGELTRVSAAPSGNQDRVDQNMDQIQLVLSQFLRLARPPSHVPHITFTPDPVDSESSKATAPWTWTAAEAASTEAVLYPSLMHLAAGRGDLETLTHCLGSATSVDSTIATSATEVPKYGLMAGGIVNCLDAGSGRSPLHVAALNGHTKAVNLLLQSGALVHLRDTMGHTALYYVSPLFPRQFSQ